MRTPAHHPSMPHYPSSPRDCAHTAVEISACGCRWCQDCGVRTRRCRDLGRAGEPGGGAGMRAGRPDPPANPGEQASER